MSKWQKPSPNSIPWDAKAAGNYMINTLSKHYAEKNGFNDSMMLDYQGNIAEATGANVFFVNSTPVSAHLFFCLSNKLIKSSISKV